MKKLAAIMLTLALVLSAIAVPAYAENDVQMVFGQIMLRRGEQYVLTDDDGQSITVGADPEVIDIQIGMSALFTIENRAGKKYITSYEYIPESGMNVGYLCRFYADEESLIIYTDSMNMYDTVDNILVNGERCGAYETLEKYKGPIAFRLRGGDGKVVEIECITEPKQTIENQRYADGTFDGLKYPITENTKALHVNGYGVVSNVGFKQGYTYSFDVISYDKHKNARLIVINDMYTYGMGLYEGDGDGIAIITDENNNTHEWEYDDDSIFDDIWKMLGAKMIEFTYNEDGVISAAVLEGMEFTDCACTKDNGRFTLGEYALDEIPAFEIETEDGRVIKYERFEPDDKLQYSGKVFTSSFGQRILWVTESKPAEGNPVVQFWANERDNKLRVGAIYSKNGYEADGEIYLAAYYKGKLNEIYTYSLTDRESGYDIENEEPESVIYGTIRCGENDDISDYTVKGFVWDGKLSPLFSAVPVTIERR